MKNLFIVGSFALLLIPSIVLAQSSSDTKPRIYLGVNTGTLSPTEDNSFTDAGLAYGASLTVVSGGFLGVGLSYLGAINGETALGEATSFQSGSADFKLMVPVLDENGAGFTPYLRVGVGLYQFKANFLGSPVETGINAQVPVGGGLLVDLNDQLALGGDVAYHFLFDASFDENPERSNLDAWEASVNLAFKL
jgi:hypothetical protein